MGGPALPGLDCALGRGGRRNRRTAEGADPPRTAVKALQCLVTTTVLKGATVEGAAIELPVLSLILFDGAQVVRMENFDIDQRDMALARFGQLDTSSG